MPKPISSESASEPVNAARISMKPHPLTPTLSQGERVRTGHDAVETASCRINIDAMLAASFARQGVLMAWDARLTGAADGACEVVLPMSAAVTQQHGFFHGGVIGALADVAGGYAANTLLMPSRECLTAEYKINIVAPGIGERLIARGQVVKAGKTLVVASANVFVVKDGVEKLCAIMQQTLFVIPVTSNPT